ncbi:UPF0158 family protein [Nocardioides speluncae]|uniref:UPF0158 family protein n=1 Tax=Nocardioides speluncae TaxID=2670337 RepID=UPI000D68BA4F|nr:UPF0158 family protein [Nocardioides speluncae]
MTQALPLTSIDLEELARHLDSPEYGAGYFDPATGAIYQALEGEVLGDDGEPVDLDDTDWVSLGGRSSHEAYDDMAAFAAAVADPKLVDRLESALRGRGAFRRFKDAMYAAPEPVGRAWNSFRNSRAEIRAVAWLLTHEFVSEADGSVALEDLHRACDEALAVARTPTAVTCESDDLPARWRELSTVVESGENVVLLKDGEPWALIDRL